MGRKLRFTAIKTNNIVDCKFLSHVNIFRPGLQCPYWHSFNNNATPCALATYTHPFSRSLTQKDVHVSPQPVCLPHPDQNISSIIVYCLMAVSVTHRIMTREGSTHSSPSTLKFISRPFGGTWRSSAQLTHKVHTLLLVNCLDISSSRHSCHRRYAAYRMYLPFRRLPVCLARFNKTLLFYRLQNLIDE